MMENNDISLQKAKWFMNVLGGMALLLAPFLTFVGWGISHNSLSSFFQFNFLYKDTNAASHLTANSSPALVFRYYLLPHYFIYASMPIYMALSLTLMKRTFHHYPWISMLGAILSIIGGTYFTGVLGAYLSAPIGSVTMTNILKISFGLCLLVFVGNILLGMALYKSKLIARWSSSVFILGNVLILLFPGIENWMALGSMMMVVALFPLARKLLANKVAW